MSFHLVNLEFDQTTVNLKWTSYIDELKQISTRGEREKTRNCCSQRLKEKFVVTVKNWGNKINLTNDSPNADIILRNENAK